jgi:hypothetical protein
MQQVQSMTGRGQNKLWSTAECIPNHDLTHNKNNNEFLYIKIVDFYKELIRKCLNIIFFGRYIHKKPQRMGMKAEHHKNPFHLTT